MKRDVTRHVIDLETYGVGDHAAIASIGIQSFNLSRGFINSFYVVVDRPTCTGSFEDGTLSDFWMKPENSAAFNEVLRNPAALPEPVAADKCHRYLSNFYDDSEVWGNGPTFDLVKLRNLFDRNGLRQPWKFWNERDARTVEMLGELSGFNYRKLIPFEGMKHHALDDARHEAMYIKATLERLVKCLK